MSNILIANCRFRNSSSLESPGRQAHLWSLSSVLHPRWGDDRWVLPLQTHAAEARLWSRLHSTCSLCVAYVHTSSNTQHTNSRISRHAGMPCPGAMLNSGIHVPAIWTEHSMMILAEICTRSVHVCSTPASLITCACYAAYANT